MAVRGWSSGIVIDPIVVDVADDDGYRNVPLGIALIVALMLVSAGIFVYGRRRERRRSHDVPGLAARLGYQADTGDSIPPSGFTILSVTADARIFNQMWRAGESARVFDLRHSGYVGDDYTTIFHTIAMVPLPFDAPALQIGPEGFWSRLGRVTGDRGVEIGSDAFDDAFRVRCADERFASALLDEATVAWLQRHASPHGRTIRFEMAGPWLLCIDRRLDVEQFVGFLEWAKQIPPVFPDTLRSSHPLPR